MQELEHFYVFICLALFVPIDKDNLNRLKLEHPDIYEQYVTVSVHRRFTVKSDAEAA